MVTILNKSPFSLPFETLRKSDYLSPMLLQSQKTNFRNHCSHFLILRPLLFVKQSNNHKLPHTTTVLYKNIHHSRVAAIGKNFI